MISGWGFKEEGDPTTVSDVLQFTTLTVFPDVRCVDAYGKWFKEGMFCAGIVNGGRDACKSIHILAEKKSIIIFQWHISPFQTISKRQKKTA